VSPTSVTTQTQPTTAPTTHAATTTPTSSKHNLATLGQTKFVPPTTATVITQIQSTSVPIIQASIIAASTTQASTTALMSTKDRSITSVALTSITTRRTDVPTQSLTTVTPTRVQEGI
jgi:O-acetyl-ADP-ribose deacetylase (regulator of RNase III)